MPHSNITNDLPASNEMMLHRAGRYQAPFLESEEAALEPRKSYLGT